MLKWAALGKTSTDPEGRFVIAMKMTNWPRGTPRCVRPSSSTLGESRLAKRLLSSLALWPASPALKLRSLDLVSGAQARLARLKATEAQGLADKLQIPGWMFSSSRTVGAMPAQRPASPGPRLVADEGRSRLFYADSRL